MRVRVDPERCQGHGRCFALAPQLYEVDELGAATARGDGTVAPEHEKVARLTVANCPEFAIELIED